MKTRNLAWLISFLCTLILILEVLIINFLFRDNTILASVISIVIFFALSYFIVRYWLRREIYDKVRTIYKNIYSFKVSKIDLKQKIKSSVIGLEQVNNEVDKWMEDSNKKMDNMLALEKFRKEYIGNIAHELKTPIFTIQGYVSTLLDGAKENPELLEKYLLRAENGIDRMIAIIQDLDTITQLELGVMPINDIEFDILPLIRETIESLELKAKERNVELVLMAKDPILVYADKGKIRQVLVNLIENGIKYSKDEGGEVRIKVFDMDDQYLIEISDHGIGIEEKDVNRLFERFFRTDKARSRQFGGTGLGLAIVKHIIEAHNQTINVRSKFGQGTVFGFTLKKA